ncbi:Derepression protein [Edwardsiella piscicida]|uniref:Derepression protein n=1 Tax=Edwardsiella piscicida TaxID=1263550 RepID=UPI000D524B42|nr:Derepression protein [Edwardsiella piscicida]UCQ40793.1 Derepression protein [Edwardsiella piscicida]
MRNKNTPQSVSAHRDVREHLSIEAYHKLNRAHSVSQSVGLDLWERKINGMHNLFVPHILSYLHEDISYVLEELKDKGLCRDFLIQQGQGAEEDHV